MLRLGLLIALLLLVSSTSVRSYFEVPVPARATTYRVATFQWEWFQSGGGDPRR